MNLGVEICYRAGRWLQKRRPPGQGNDAAPTSSSDDYQAWREDEVSSHFLNHFSLSLLEDKDVVDFGCGGGEMAFFIANNGARSVTGIEVAEHQYDLALKNRSRSDTRIPVDLIFSERPDIVPLADDSCDVMICFDVLEHIIEYKAAFAEWARVMRPGGRILIWWVPYYHPYGHHLYSTLPVPWAHVLFSEKTLIQACSKIYNDPDFTPPIWDLDADGHKMADRWTGNELSDLNRVTIRQFEEMIPEYGFIIDRREYEPVGNDGPVGTISRSLSKSRKLREYFTASVIYELRRHGD